MLSFGGQIKNINSRFSASLSYFTTALTIYLYTIHCSLLASAGLGKYSM